MLKKKLQELCKIIYDNKDVDLIFLLCEIHNTAGKISSNEDYDFASKLLESTANDIQDIAIKIELYRHALFRAKWHAAESTSSCDGISRSAYVTHLELKINDLLKVKTN